MDLRSGHAFWPIQDGLIHSYPPLREDAQCEVLVLGGGITGALMAYHLAEAGIDVLLLERRGVAQGSTAASTALLQYEVDTHLSDLIGMVGKWAAERSYLLCLESIIKIEELTQRLPGDCGFARKQSLYLASRRRDVRALEEEYAARRAIGIDVELLGKKEISAEMSFDAPAALLSAVAAQVDPYRFTHLLLAEAERMGARIYDRTTATSYKHDGDSVRVETDRGATVTARRVVFATGYESQEYLKQKVAKLNSTYALMSEPLDGFPGWGFDQCLLWESARPYFYARTTSDGRILIGGEDESGARAHNRRFLDRVATRLQKRLARLFPDIPLEVAYTWGGTFAETEDGLAYIGTTPEFPNGYFALGFGGNGITYSLIAAELIRDAILGRPNPDAAIFAFERTR